MKVMAKDEEKHYKLTAGINTLLLITHILLLLMFAHLKITIMVYVNIVSVSIYLFMYLVFRKSLVKYVFTVYLEVLIHMVLATICVGWDAGFQLYCFSLIPCIFLCDYLSRTDGHKSIYPVAISMGTLFLFLVTRAFCTINSSIYEMMSREENLNLFIFNAVATFMFLIIYMYVFDNRILDKEKQLESMAELDELTKLPNRYLMHEWINNEFNMIDDSNKIAIAILDIDDFKILNDTFGHEFGDIVLKEIAGDIKRLSYENIKICRWGGEEFVFMASKDNAYLRMKELLEELRCTISNKSMLFQSQVVNVTVTIGIAEYNKGDTNFHDILRRADERLYMGKENGKNCVVGKEAM